MEEMKDEKEKNGRRTDNRDVTGKRMRRTRRGGREALE